MKSNSMGSQVRRHTGERERRRGERHEESTHHTSRDVDRSDYHRAESKKDHIRGSRALEKKPQKEHWRETKEYRSTKDDKRSSEKNNSHDKRYRPVSPHSRRKGGHRNSPIELTVKGCRNTDSSSSSSSDSESDRSIHRNHENARKRRRPREEREDSYEELSRKKRQIESELSALLAEEAENDRIHNERKKSNRNQEFHERVEDVRPGRRIKQERVSDDEHGNRNAHRNSPKRTGEKMEWGKKSSADQKKPVKDKEKPNFGVSGKLAEDTNTYNGVVIKYNEPKEARKPKRRWRLYPFKGETSLDFIPIHRQSAYLFGRSRLIADIPIDHPSCSKQHAVLQYRLMNYKRDDGTVGRRLRPYIIDLESSNGTYVNNKKVEPRCYVELLEKDIIKFGYSSREYVILHDQSKDESLDDDVTESP